VIAMKKPFSKSHRAHFIISLSIAVCLLAAAQSDGQSTTGRGSGQGQDRVDTDNPPKDPPTRGGGGGGGGFGLSIDLSRLFGGGSGRPDPVKTLDKNGPQFPDRFNMSSFSVIGFVKGNWPIVIDREATPGSYAYITVVADGVEPFYYRLNTTQGGRVQERFSLPARFGDSPTPARYDIRALTAGPGEVTPAYIRIFGIAVGDKAVGSVNIDQLRFQPGQIRPKQKEEADYSFRAREDFNEVQAEFYWVGLSQGQILSIRVDSKKIGDGILRDQTVSKKWDGKNEKGKTAQGQHVLQVRAWRGLKSGGDWVAAQSAEVVRVVE
jgi:hypothetical protein